MTATPADLRFVQAADVDPQSLPPLVHVYPINSYGRPHVLDGLLCWCEPQLDADVPTLVIHNDLH